MTNPQVWLARATYERLRMELTDLLRERSAFSPLSRGDSANGPDESDQHTDHDVVADRRDRENRIRTLQELLFNPLIGEPPPDDGIAEPGMLLTVRYLEDQDTETFLLAHREENGSPDIEICSPDSPLGRAVAGAREGATCEYRLPDGRIGRVRLERAVPYGASEQPVRR